MAQPFSLWVLGEPHGTEVLLVAEDTAGAMEVPLLLREPASIRAFLAERGLPQQIFANLWSSVRFVRQAEQRLFQVPAAVLKPKELVGPLVVIALRGYRK